MNSRDTNSMIRIPLTIVAVLAPVLNAYPSIIPQLELGTFLSLIVFFILIFGQHGNIRISVGCIQLSWLLFLGIVAVCSVISTKLMHFNSEIVSTITMRYFKIVVCIFVFIIVGEPFFDKDLGFKVARMAGLANTILVFLQTLTHNRLIGRISNEALFRPAGFFYEPSNLGSYMIVVLCLVLFDKNLRFRTLWIGITILGILLSTSGTGAVLIPAVALLYFLFGGRYKLKLLYRISLVIVGVAGLTIGIYIFSRTSLGAVTLSRFITSDGLGGSYNGRFASYANTLVKNMPMLYKIIGYGYGYRPNEWYFTSYNAITYGDGIIGLIMLLFVFMVSYFKGNLVAKTLLICYICLFMGAGIFNFGAIAYFFSFIIANQKEVLTEEC